MKRCLYIGLGGTGMTALLHTKKMFVETYGEVPPMIGFLGVDADRNAYEKEIPSKYGNIKLERSEQIQICVQDARAEYDAYSDRFTWIPEENIYALGELTNGCGQVRSNGRFALTSNFRELSDRVQATVSRICDPNIVDNEKYDVNFAAEVEVHMAFSLAGGTGSGTFINMAYLIKNILGNNCKLAGYAALPDVFEQMQTYGMKNVKPNAYGALWDLDWFMHFDGRQKYQFDYFTTTQDVKDRPFDAFFVVDNKNENGDTHSDIKQLTEMMSLALVTASGELSMAAASVTDNVRTSINNGDGMVGNKRAWISGMGACEIIFRGKDMSSLYALKNAQRIIQRMMSSCKDANNLANAWIDSPEVNIRENGGSQNDNVIDFLLSKNPDIPLSSIDDKQNGESEVNQYLNNVGVPQSKEVKKNEVALSERVKVELHKLVVNCVEQDCGIGLAKDVLDAITSQVNVFLDEMNEEKEQLTAKQPQLDNAIKVAAEDLREQDGRFLKLRGRINECADALCVAGMASAVNQREIMRRNSAITFFNGLLVDINNEQLKIQDIKNKLKAANQIYADEIAKLINNVGVTYSSYFQIDLAQSVVNTIGVNDDEIQINDFLISLNEKNTTFYNIDSLSPQQAADAILSYTNGLPTTIKWAQTTIDHILNEINDKNPEELDNILHRAWIKAMPLLNINTRGQVGYTYGRFSYVGVPMGSTILQKGGRLSNIAGGNRIQFANLNQMKDRVIIYNQVGVVPTYFLANIENYKQRYANCSTNAHIDDNFFIQMQREKFSIYPLRENDNKDIEYWVLGFAFGLIKNEGGKYYVKDEEYGEALDEYWVELAQYRDQAFLAFKKNLSVLQPQFKDYFKNYEKSQGLDEKKNHIIDVKANYLSKYSQINMTTAEIKERGNEGIHKLINQELDFVKKIEL